MSEFYKQNTHAVVFDLEYTTWEGALERDWSGENEFREIFQISALKVDLARRTLLDSFDRFVCPRKQPLLSEYAKALTGVTQAEVDNGVDFRTMYTDFIVWADTLNICSYARNFDPEGDGSVLKENIDLYELDLPYGADRFMNVINLFKRGGIDVTKYSNGQLHECFEIELSGRLHDAQHDAKSLSLSLIALREDVDMERGVPLM